MNLCDFRLSRYENRKEKSLLFQSRCLISAGTSLLRSQSLSRHDLPAVGGSTERSFMTVTRQSRERQNTSVKVLVCLLIILITSLLWKIEKIEKNVGTKFKWNGILLSIHIIIL